MLKTHWSWALTVFLCSVTVVLGLSYFLIHHLPTVYTGHWRPACSPGAKVLKTPFTIYWWWESVGQWQGKEELDRPSVCHFQSFSRLTVCFLYAFCQVTPSLVPVLYMVTDWVVSILFQSLFCSLCPIENRPTTSSHTRTPKPSHLHTRINSKKCSNLCATFFPFLLLYISLPNNDKIIRVRQLQPLIKWVN